jgi:DNA-binding beta-propeller fold protein YncE
MKKEYILSVAVFCLVTFQAQAQSSEPLKLIQRFTMPSEVKGQFDHLAVDIKGHRLFATAMDYKAVEVFDYRTGKILHTIRGIERPHAVLYRDDLDRIYATDGEAAELKIFDGKTYKLLNSVKLLVDADSIGYDAATKYAYIVNGGGDAHQAYSMISVVDTTGGEKLADIKVEGETLEAMVLEKASPRIYVNNKAKNQVTIIDRERRTVEANWPVTMGKTNVAMAFDEANHRLFVACRSGKIVVFDSQSGKELRALDINQGVDDMVFDASSKRIYATCGAGAGSVDIYEEVDPDNYKFLGEVSTGPGDRNGRLSPELHRFFIAAPQHGTTNAEVLVYEVQ